MKPKIKVTERMVQTTDGSRELRYYTSIDHNCHIEKQEFLDCLLDQYGIPVVHTLVVLEAIQKMLKNEIGRGYIVEVPYLGLFKLQLRAKTTKNADEAGRQAVSRFKVNFLPCKEISCHFSKDD